MYRTASELYPEDWPHTTFLEARESNRKIDDIKEPTNFDLWAYLYAIESYRGHMRYGLPFEGGYEDMPYVWRLATDCVYEAVGAAKAQASAEARQERAKEQDY